MVNDASEAWLFDAYVHPKRSAIVVWIKHGNSVTKRIIAYKPTFLVQSDTKDLGTAERLLAEDPRVEATWRDESRLWLRGDPMPVLRILPKRMQDTHGIASRLRQRTHTKGFVFYHVDHAQECRWMHERGLFSMCRLHVGAHGPELRLAEGEDRWMLMHPDPGLKTLRLAVDVDRQGPTPTWDDPLLRIRVGDEAIEGDERDALLALGRVLRKQDPDAILTRHGDRFDVPYLLRRIRAHGLEHQVWLGRAADPDPARPDQEAKSLHTYGRWLHKTHAYYLRGRWHIDLSKKTLDSEDDRRDLWGILYLARIANRRAQDVNRNGAGFALQQMQIDAATDQGVALPWKRNLTEEWKDLATLCAVDRGGQIMVPEPGIHEDVAACDFSGYYPSLVVTHNLSSDTINCACCPEGPVIPELGHHVCTRVDGHQACVLRRVWPHRAEVKALLRRARVVVLVDRARAVKSEQKAIGVVCFGYFRYRNARFGCAEVHQAIQCLGRDGMTRARLVAEEHGFDMVHAMTDCAFLQRRGVTAADARRVARAITAEVQVPMDVEGVYKWIVFLPSKTHSTASGVGVPNRYYGKFMDGTLKVRGIEVQRHSTPDWVYEAQQGMLDVLAQAEDAAGFHERIPEALGVAKDAARRLRERSVPAEALGIMVQATRSVEEYAANTDAREALLRLREAGIERRPGEYVKYVKTRGKGAWKGRVAPVELLGQDGWFGAAGGVDEAHYLRLLARSVETLLSPFGYEEDALCAWLSGAAPSPIPDQARLC